MSSENIAQRVMSSSMTRRQLITRSLKVGIPLALASPLLVACEDDESGVDQDPAVEPEGDDEDATEEVSEDDDQETPEEDPEDDEEQDDDSDEEESDDAEAASGGQLVVGLVAEPVALDGSQVTDVNSARVIRRVTEQLVAFDDEDPELVPGLAESWDISDDGLEYTFSLREGVMFHDGTPFNAEAVEYSLLRQVNEDHPAHGYGTYPYSSFYFATLDSVEIVDEYTATIIQSTPRASFLAALAAAAAGIVSPTAVEEYGEDYPQHPVGTGPFEFVSWNVGVEVILQANQDYWGNAPGLDRVIFQPFIEEQARLTALQTGGVNFIVDVPPDNIEPLEEDANITVLKQTGIHFWYVGFNVTSEPLTDARVRQALAHAIDKESITRDVLKGTGEPAISMLNPGTWGFTDDIPVYEYDPDRARELLEEAGHGDGLEISMWVPESGSGMQSPVPMATVIQANWADVGVTAEIQTFEWGAFLDTLRTGDQQVFCNSWMAGLPDPDMTLFPFLHSSQHAPNGPNRFFYTDEEVDRLLEEARASTDQDERAEMYREVQRIVYEDVPLIPIEHQVQTAAMTQNVTGFELHPNFDLLRIKDTQVDEG
jgi:peptide/nickel transport system substrate-binding protein